MSKPLARIELLPDEQIGWFARLLKRAVARRTKLNQPSLALNLLAHHKQVMAANTFYMGILDRWRKVPRRLKRLIHLRVAMRVGCPA